MPIRFRCAYCNQLLGISRRKAGQVVRCPTCAGQVVVPQADDLPPDQEQPTVEPPSPSPAAEAPLFERDDFGLDFDNPVPSLPATHGSPAPAAAPPAPSGWAAGPSAGFDVEPFRPTTQLTEVGAPAGILLSPAKATLLTVLAILGMAIAFGAGLIVGRFML
jgi:DNA-directed RNA polymerase subunit RPC12/RpoP